MYNIIIISFGASFGALLRWIISLKLNNIAIHGIVFPVGTLLINLIGCYIIGFTSFIFANSYELRLLFIVGFLGSFTTFSTFSIESLEFLKNQKIALFVLHYCLNSIGAIIMVICGYYSFLFCKKIL